MTVASWSRDEVMRTGRLASAAIRLIVRDGTAVSLVVTAVPRSRAEPAMVVRPAGSERYTAEAVRSTTSEAEPITV